MVSFILWLTPLLRQRRRLVGTAHPTVTYHINVFVAFCRVGCAHQIVDYCSKSVNYFMAFIKDAPRFDSIPQELKLECFRIHCVCHTHTRCLPVYSKNTFIYTLLSCVEVSLML